MLRDDPKYHLRKRLCVTGKTKVLFVEEERKTKHNKQSKIISDMKVYCAFLHSSWGALHEVGKILHQLTSSSCRFVKVTLNSPGVTLIPALSRSMRRENK